MAPLAVEDFTDLMQAIKSHEKLVIERRTSWEHHLDVLGNFIAEEEKNRNLGRINYERTIC